MIFRQWMIAMLLNFLAPLRPRSMEWKMWLLLNRDRRKHGLKNLVMQEDLRRVAREHSRDMAKLDYFEHENFLGHTHVDRLKEAQISDVVSGENLAKIGGFPFPVQRAETGLMNSPGHRANILNRSYNCVGIGLHKSEKKVHFFTQNFAYRQLIFSSRIPETTRLIRGLHLKFKPLGRVHNGIAQIKTQTETVREKSFKILPGKNHLHLQFPNRGHYTVNIFTMEEGQKNLILTHQIKIRVKQGLFG